MFKPSLSQIKLDDIVSHKGCLYLGDKTNSYQTLINHNITTVISLGFDVSPYAKYDDIKTYHLAIMDSPDIETVDILGYYLPRFADIIDCNLYHNQNIFIHCHAGISRSATVVIYYVLLKLIELPIKQTDYLSKAIKIVKDQRSCIHPNNGFLQLLFKIEIELLS